MKINYYKKLIAAEILIIFASVLIFRSVWLLLDSQLFMNRGEVLWISLVVGIIVIVPAFNYIIRQDKEN